MYRSSILTGHGCSLLEVGHQHGGVLHAERVIAIAKLLERRLVEVGELGGCVRRALAAAGRVASLRLCLEGHAAVFGVDGTVVSQQEVSPDEGGAAFAAFERSFFRVWR